MENEYVTKLKTVIKERTVVYIDAANLEQSVKGMKVHAEDVSAELANTPVENFRWSVDYRKLKEFFSSMGAHQGVRFYTADFGSDSHRKFCYFLDKGLEFKLVTKPLKEYKDHTPEAPHRKANFDVEIAVDSTFSLASFDTFILFSGDCDFEYLIKFLRGQGKVVIGFSRSGNIAKEIPPALSYYFDIADFRNEFLRIDRLKAKDPKPFGPGPRY
jgi:uncharacterized LabA/DUF88 family protein